MTMQPPVILLLVLSSFVLGMAAGVQAHAALLRRAATPPAREFHLDSCVVAGKELLLRQVIVSCPDRYGFRRVEVGSAVGLSDVLSPFLAKYATVAGPRPSLELRARDGVWGRRIRLDDAVLLSVGSSRVVTGPPLTVATDLYFHVTDLYFHVKKAVEL